MEFLYLDFSDNLNNGPKYGGEFYKESLKDQYQQLIKRIPEKNRISSFEEFIKNVFCVGVELEYFISWPNFERENINTAEEMFYRNIVIRANLPATSKKHLPDGQNVILIGDIDVRFKKIRIKAVQFLDESIYSKKDLSIKAAANTAFSRDSWTIFTSSSNVLTDNLIADMITNCWTVSNPAEVIAYKNKWKKYLEFRDYYIQEQAKRHLPVSSSEFLDSYAINKKQFNKNSLSYEREILDGREEFIKGDMVLLNKKVLEAESFPLIKLVIDINKSVYLTYEQTLKKRTINKYDQKLRSLSRDNVFITSSEVNPESSDYKISNLLRNGYSLGDRFKIITYDVLPEEHLQRLEASYKRDLAKIDETLKNKYESLIRKEADSSSKDYEKGLKDEADKALTERRLFLNSVLQKDASENNDPRIAEFANNEIKKAIKKASLEKDKKSNEDIDQEIKSTFDINYYLRLYSKRNEEIIAKETKEKYQEIEQKVRLFHESKINELSDHYKIKMVNEIDSEKKERKKEYEADKQTIIAEETIKRYCLYYTLIDPTNKPSNDDLRKINDCKYIVYDDRAEKSLINRETQAIKNFFNGYVKNPYLSTYLFNPELLGGVTAQHSDWTWHLETLNEKQKDAVRKAVYSNGIFLLQGPPGTGKTQVIAETVAQLVKKGKKVLISSETHKAIDNVFERLPKVGDIVPIRLIASYGENKKNNYDPQYLVDNFYTNISDNMEKSIERYKNFQRNKEQFAENFDLLKLNKSKLDKNTSILENAKNEISDLEAQTKKINREKSQKEEEQDLLKTKLDILRRTKRNIERLNIKESDDVDFEIVSKFQNRINDLIVEDYFKKDDLPTLLTTLSSINISEIHDELLNINPDAKSTKLASRKIELRKAMESCRDELEEIIPGKEEEYENYKKELREVINQINTLDSKVDTDSRLALIFDYNFIVNNLDKVESIILKLKNDIKNIVDEILPLIVNKSEELDSQIESLESEIRNLVLQIRDINNSIDDINERTDVKEINSLKQNLELDIDRFFKDFDIAESYKNIDDAIFIIENQWKDINEDFKTKEAENKRKIPMYEKIVRYINNPDVIKEDRKTYTKELFESANVFGMTCTSRDRFRQQSLQSFEEFNIEELDIKKVGIDVVIIDEVSKSSFVDLLIPILYGKTVILVGDHRQLPPMYDFAKMRQSDFEGLDENIINPAINKEYCELCEECFFKTLFEKLSSDYKTMLEQQYRCHSHIMNVFNHFYNQQLKIGSENQDNKKKHNINLYSNGIKIIEPEKHTYFINCRGKECQEDDSTSKFNINEANVVVELTKKINDYFVNNDKFEKLSIGIISTYGDQAKRIRKMMKKVKLDGFNIHDEKFIVSTVDDFQGDERDIIILTMVRNPINPAMSDPGFILAYQRINVALSRARKLLIIVGNKDYLERKGVIDLPNINGNHRLDQKGFRVYSEIISTIETNGKVLEDYDILERDGEHNG